MKKNTSKSGKDFIRRFFSAHWIFEKICHCETTDGFKSFNWIISHPSSKILNNSFKFNIGRDVFFLKFIKQIKRHTPPCLDMILHQNSLKLEQEHINISMKLTNFFRWWNLYSSWRNLFLSLTKIDLKKKILPFLRPLFYNKTDIEWMKHSLSQNNINWYLSSSIVENECHGVSEDLKSVREEKTIRKWHDIQEGWQRTNGRKRGKHRKDIETEAR